MIFSFRLKRKLLGENLPSFPIGANIFVDAFRRVGAAGVLLLVGGLLPLAIAFVALFALPESLKFLMQKGGHDNEVSQLARALRPDLAIDAETRFSARVPAEVVGGGGSSDPCGKINNRILLHFQ